jgi:hypothetical protein
METLYKWVDGILEEKQVALIDMNGWISMFGWSPDPTIEPPVQVDEPAASRKRSALNAANTTGT